MKKFLLLAAAVAAVTPVFAQEINYLDSDYYVIGGNVNGKAWACGEEDAKFEAKGNGVWEWTGEVLGTGFKFNNGTWDDGAPNLGGSAPLKVGEKYVLTQGSQDNIALAPIDGVQYARLDNPKITLTVDGSEVSVVVEGTPAGRAGWFLVGDYNGWEKGMVDEYQFQPTNEAETEFKLTVTFSEDLELPTIFKVGYTGWADEWGSPMGEGLEELVVGMGEDSATLVAKSVAGSVGNVQSYLVGTYDVTFSTETGVLSFTEEGAVEEVAVAAGEASYFNLQGLRVNNVENGLYIKVVNGKAQKVLVRK